MTNYQQRAPEAMIYQICLRGQLDQTWAEWFAGLEIVALTNGDTLLVGLIADQAALYGLIKKIRDLGMPLISLMPLNSTTSSFNPHEQV
ncbi:hypothetical protein [Herpetosiphon llansteffanensis]|uniref:hypothetical protein n=1 Tax=Herpetosiphon llansteffanensis TaxID=2094568 RepID=UPI00196A1EC5|nr:hypothetical protein [Herpetosiphon llansteffanensis]